MLAALFVLLASFPAQAASAKGNLPDESLQEKKITGKVTDQNGEPMTGVTIMVKGTTTGVISDLNGAFSITVPDNNAVLSVSFIGYATKEVAVGNQSVINIQLAEDVQLLEDVIVVAYGTQKKSHLTGAVASVKAETLDEIPVSRVDQALQGKLAGVQVNNLGSYAGEAPEIRVRGLGSISTNIDPLIVVDGFPVSDGLSMVSMGDVESIEVLKDASSSALYGSRAANGVILITTKSGNITKPTYNFKMFSGIRNALELPGKLTTMEYVELLYEEAALRMTDPSVDGTSATMAFNLANEVDRLNYLQARHYVEEETDWLDEAMRDFGTLNNFQLSASGGNSNTRYFFSANYNNEQGIMEKSNYDRFTFRAKVDTKLSKAVSVGINISPTYSQQEVPAVDLTDYLRFPGWLPVRHNAATAALTGQMEGDWAQPYHFKGLSMSGLGIDDEVWHITSANGSGSSNNNPISVRDRTDIFTDDYRVQGNAYITIDIIQGLQFKTSNGIYAQYKEYNKMAQTSANKVGEPNRLERQTTLRTDFLTENTLHYIKTIGGHEFGILGGFTAQQTNDESNTIIGTGFPDEELLSFNLATSILLNSSETAGTTSFYYSESLVSFLGRLTYAYEGKYLLSASIRADGSSKFAEGNKWGTFPAGSVGWRLSEEEFLKNVEWLSNLKVRFSYGLTGNNNIPQYSYLNYLNTSNYVTGTGIGSLVSGLAANNDFLGNPDITWEQTQEANYGIDMGFFKNRLSLSAEYYNSKTIQLLLQQPSMYITGHKTFWNNIGEVSNKGIEIELSTTNIDKKDFSWRTSANFTSNKNTLLNYGNKDKEDNFGERNEVYRAQVGQPSIQFFGYKSDGVYLTFEEVAAAKALTDEDGNPFSYSKFAPVVGGLKVVNVNGDNAIDENDRVVLGDPFPDFIWGLTNTFTYRSFDLSFLLQGVQGGQVIDGNANYNETLRTNTVFVENRYVSPMYPGDGKTVYGTNTSGGNLMLSDYVISDASYTALRDLTLGYNAPKKLTDAIKVANLRIYFSGQNLFYLMAKDYKGVNPEARRTSGPYSNPLIDGYQRGVYPIYQTYTAGLDITF
ncbi:MAG: TonB-dependent receptor [Bacteroidales bacterium]|nr:TonB-dependent receptor [Bacteroidales bacterium]